MERGKESHSLNSRICFHGFSSFISCLLKRLACVTLLKLWPSWSSSRTSHRSIVQISQKTWGKGNLIFVSSFWKDIKQAPMHPPVARVLQALSSLRSLLHRLIWSFSLRSFYFSFDSSAVVLLCWLQALHQKCQARGLSGDGGERRIRLSVRDLLHRVKGRSLWDLIDCIPFGYFPTDDFFSFKYLTTILSLITLLKLLVQIYSYNTWVNACLPSPKPGMWR